MYDGARIYSMLKDTPCLAQHEYFPPYLQQLLEHPAKSS